MNKTFLKRQYSFLRHTVLLTIILFGVHGYLIHYFIECELFFPVWQIYAFLFITTLLLYSIINYKYTQGKIQIFNLFMVATLIKMVIAVLFLLPLINSELENKKPDIFNFFIPYFLFLILEIYSITALLNNNP